MKAAIVVAMIITLHISSACLSLIVCALCHCATPQSLLVEDQIQDNNGDESWCVSA